MKISKNLMNEILKLNKAEWEKVKGTIDALFDKELRDKKKEIFISKENLEQNIKNTPYFIEIEK